MNAHKLIISTLLLLLAASAACQEETPANTPGEFGDPCVPGADQNSPDGCVDGTGCYNGYCEEVCLKDSDCQQVEGWAHFCLDGLCRIMCDGGEGCPDDLGTALTCEPFGGLNICEATEDDS